MIKGKLLKDLLIVILLIPILTLFQYLLNLNFLWGTLLFYGLPSLYITIKAPYHALRTLPFALIFGVVAGFIADFISISSGIWFTQDVSLPYIFGVLPLDDLVWGVFLAYYIIMFYEYFVDRNEDYLENRRHKFLFYSLLITAVIVTLIHVADEGLLIFSNPYLLIGIPGFIIFPAFVILKNPRYLTRFLLPSVFFFVHSFVFESVATIMNYWHFPSDVYIGWVTVFNASFPFEEFLFFPVLFAFTILCVYEYFYDYRRKRE